MQRILVRGLVTLTVAFILIPLTGCTPTSYDTPAPTGAKALAAQLAARAVGTVGDCPTHQPLVMPPVLSAVGDGAVLDTRLTVQSRSHTEPVVIATDQNVPTDCQMTDMDLRTYGYGTSPVYGIPGPTLRVNKTYLLNPALPPDGGNEVTKTGSRIKITLANELPHNPLPAHECEPASYLGCSTNTAEECAYSSDTGLHTCTSDPTASCVEVEVPQEAPNCFHGADITNLHFHGSHFSPQPFQDFVLLSLYSSNQQNPPPANDYDVAVGTYPIDVPQVPWNQPPGTHWYHPHKHGSTALQVGNGMAGALLIEGPFDDFLYGYYGVDPANATSLDAFEKLLVVHQAKESLPFYQRPLPPGEPPYPLVNGQLIPTVTMKYGEVQRWRMIGATMNTSAQLNITFPDDFEVTQIAQDGIQFAPENYERQPLTTNGSWTLSPGNRIDYLIKAPEAEDTSTRRLYYVGHRVIGHLPERIRERVKARADGIREKLAVTLTELRQLDADITAADTTTEILFAIELVGESPTMNLPTTSEWPPMPYYLADIDTVDGYRSVAYSMSGPVGGQPNAFFIDGEQFQSGCVNQSPVLDTAEEWTITNQDSIGHPHHIHTNPFQLIRKDGNVTVNNDTGETIISDPTDYQPPYPWMDTIALPTTAVTTEIREVKLRTRYDDYTGAFVLHCHFLGHEDRGMMQTVQTVCPANFFGLPQTGGQADDCQQISPLYPPGLNPYPACSN
ncbi:MAG: multicopper oxidase domain-containing protein [Acidobacteriota bacterium]